MKLQTAKRNRDEH